MAETYYLTLDDAIGIHDAQLSLYGGAAGIRDLGLIDSALLRPQTGYYGDLIEEAAALWESLTMNDGFIDGNKRVAFACTLVFLDVNGVLVEGDQDEAIAFIYGHLEARTFRKPVLEGWLRSHSRPMPTD